MVQGEWLLGMIGALSLLFGALVAMQPDPDGVMFMWIIEAYAVMSGALQLWLAINVQTWHPTASV